MLKDLARWLYWFPFRRLIQAAPEQLLGPLAAAFAGAESCPLWPGCRRRLRAAAWFFGGAAAAAPGPIVYRAQVLKHRYLFDTMRYPGLSKESIEGHIALHGREHLDEALAAGRGAIVLTAHFGQNQDLMPALGYRSYPVFQIGSRLETWHQLVGAEPTPIMSRVFALRDGLERSLPATFLYIDRSLRPAFRCLEQGGVLIMAFDGRAGGRWEELAVFGHRLNVNAGPAALARRSQAPLVPAFALREGSRRAVYIEPPIRVPQSEDEAGDVRQALQAFIQVLERYLHRSPEAYAGLVHEALCRADLDEVPLFAEGPAMR